MDHDEMMDAMFYETIDFDDEAEMQDWAEFWRGDYDAQEGPDFLELGFDPYMGCYSDDC